MPIEDAPLKYKIDSGIEVESYFGLVPLYYEMLACQEAGYTYFLSWQELTLRERALHVAHFIVKNLVSKHSEDASAREMEKRSKRKGSANA